MATFREFNASNEDGTCLWCGRKLVYVACYTENESDIPEGSKVTRKRRLRFRTVINYIPPGLKRGPYCDGFFCSLSCGHQFAVAMANNGRRFAPNASKD